MSEDSKSNLDTPQSRSTPWGRIYAGVLIFTVVVIFLLYTFSVFYSG